jgi:hypothetical protein
MRSVKQITEYAEQVGVSVAEIVTEVQKGGKPDKDYTLVLRFDRMQQLIDFVREHWSEEEAGVFRGMTVDSEFRGRVVPTNCYVVRDPREVRGSKRIDT